MTKFARTLLITLMSMAAAPVAALELGGADGLVHFDEAIGFPTPRTISVFRSADPADHLYHLIPNSVQIARTGDGRPQFSLFYTSEGRKKTGYVSFAINPVLETDELQAIINEIKANDPQARFAIPTPTESVFYLVGPEFGRKELTAKTPGSNPLRTPSGFSTDISSIAVRASLTSGSYKQPLFTIGHDFTIRGVARDESGEQRVISRRFATSFVLNGLCAIYPELVYDLNGDRHGCLPRSYDHRLIRDLQKQLKVRGLYAGAIDGVFGARTERAIRAFQKDESLTVDGIPDEDLLKRLAMVASAN